MSRWIVVLSLSAVINFVFAALPNAQPSSDQSQMTLQDSKAGKPPQTRLSCPFNDPTDLYNNSYGFLDKNPIEYANKLTSKTESIKYPTEFGIDVFDVEEYYSQDESNRIDISSKRADSRVLENSHVIIKINKGSANIIDKEWDDSYVNGLAVRRISEFKSNTVNSGNDQRADEKNPTIKRVEMPIIKKTKNDIFVDARMPSNDNLLKSQEWIVVPVLCYDNKVMGYGSIRVSSVKFYTALALAFIVIVIFWIGISYACWQLNDEKMNKLWQENTGWIKASIKNQDRAEWIWKFLQSAHPLFISQDSLGFGSLARFQLLIFTTVIGFIFFFVFIHSGIVTKPSDTILMLLGVQVASGVAGRTFGGWSGISKESRRWLIGTRVLKRQREKPRWCDLFETHGEIEIAKVQALLFTVVISLSILFGGLNGLNSFDIPYQIVVLASVSQGAYVVGKFFPADSFKLLEQDLNILRRTAKVYTKSKDDLGIAQEYEQAREAVSQTLYQTYADRFDKNNFDDVTKDPKNIR